MTALRLHPDDIEAVAQRVIELLGQTAGPERVLDAVAVAGLLGRSRDWVYEHAAELGGFRMGAGQTRRIGFDRARIEEWKRSHQLAGPKPEPPEPARRRGRARQPVQSDLIDFEEQ